jgi:hypothetical protein
MGNFKNALQMRVIDYHTKVYHEKFNKTIRFNPNNCNKPVKSKSLQVNKDFVCDFDFDYDYVSKCFKKIKSTRNFL